MAQNPHDNSSGYSAPATTNGVPHGPFAVTNPMPMVYGQPRPSDKPDPFLKKHERWYPNWVGKGEYLFPCDEEEMDRLDLFHKFLQVARTGDSVSGLHQRPLPPAPRVLDLGCGTAIWVIDMAIKYWEDHKNVSPDTFLEGWDILTTQPEHVPWTLKLSQVDVEGRWPEITRPFDLIHVSMLAGSIMDWPALYEKIFGALTPGSGCIEQIEIDFTPMSENVAMLENSKLKFWAQELYAAMSGYGKPMVISPDPEVQLRDCGFVDIQHTRKMIPFNPWTADEHANEIGKWFNLGLTQGLQALTIEPFSRLKGYTREQIDSLVAQVTREVCSRELRAYCTLHIWTAVRPPAAGSQRS